MRTRDESKWKARKTRPNAKKRTPIPWLSLHMRLYNRPMTTKADLARTRAWIADRVIESSFPRIERL